METSNSIQFDERGREILSNVPVAFNVPIQKRISTLDFHRQRLLEERQRMREMLEAMKEDQEFETFAEANDFSVDDPLDPEAKYSDYELDDDVVDVAQAFAEAEHSRIAPQIRKPSSSEEKVDGNPSE